MRALFLLALLPAIIGASPSAQQHSAEAEAKLVKYLNGRVPGETKHCLAVDRTNDPIGIDDQTMLFRDGPRVWRTELTGSYNCGNISRTSTIVTESAVRRLCSGDKLVFFDNGAPGGACYLGEFTVYEKP